MNDLEIIRFVGFTMAGIVAFLVTVIGITSRLKGKPVEWVRILAIVLIYTTILGVLALPPVVFSCMVALLIALGIREIFMAVKTKDPQNDELHFEIVSYAVSVPIPLIMQYQPDALVTFFVLSIVLVFCLPVFLGDYGRAMDRIGRAVCCLIFAVMLGFLVRLRMKPEGVALCIFVIFLAFLTDTAAYVFGRLFGRRKLVPRLSPGKTLEGSLSAVLATVVIAVLFARPMLTDIGLLQIILMAVVVSVGGQLGDLVLSVFKRDAGIKDYSRAIPGHGGVLDRFDSLTVSTPLFYFFLKLF